MRIYDILAKPERVVEIIRTELGEIGARGDDRRTELLVGEVLSLEDEDLMKKKKLLLH